MSARTSAGGVRISRLGLVNAYLLPEEDGLTLIDTGLRGSVKGILKGVDDLGVPVVRIVLTHAHGDHIGGLDRLAAALPDAEVSISARDARLMAGDKSLDQGEPADKLSGSYPGAETKPDRLLHAGDRVGSLEVIATPGHTPGHIALLDHRDRTIFCGDVYSTLFGVATSARINPWFPLPAVATWSRELELESAIALRALEPSALAPGHGPINVDPLEPMDDAIAMAADVGEPG